jgi:hypothetical protein
VFHAADRFGDHHVKLTSTPLSKAAPLPPPRTRTHKHQDTDSGFSESSESELRSLIHKVSELSTGADVDLTVRSAYNGRRGPPSYHQAIRHTENRLGRLPLRLNDDSKQTFTQLWVMNGHRETARRADSEDGQSVSSSCSSVDTAMSDPMSDMVTKAPQRGILLNQGLSRAVSMPSVNNGLPDSASVSSSGSSGTRKSKPKSVKFSENIMEVTISPRVPQERPSMSNALRKIRVQNVINQIGQQTPTKKPPPMMKPNTPARMAKIEERNKANLGFWI